MNQEITKITKAYSHALRSIWAEENPAWAEVEGYDVFFVKVASLVGELALEIDATVQAVAFADGWQATCFKSENGWVDLTGKHVDEREVTGMVQAGAWVVITFGMEWDAQPFKPH